MLCVNALKRQHTPHVLVFDNNAYSALTSPRFLASIVIYFDDDTLFIFS